MKSFVPQVAIGRRTKLTIGSNARVEGNGKLFIGHDLGDFPRGTASAFQMGSNSYLILSGNYLLLSGHQINICDNAGLELGSGYLNHDGKIHCRSHIKIGKNVIIGEDARIMDGDGHSLNGKKTPMPVTIEHNVWIGLRVTVLKGVTMGTGSVLAASSLVTNNIRENCLVGGCTY